MNHCINHRHLEHFANCSLRHLISLFKVLYNRLLLCETILTEKLVSKEECLQVKMTL